MKLTTQQYSIEYDLGLPLVFVGHTFYNRHLYEYFCQQRECYLVRVEDIESNSQEWFNSHQFMSAVSNIKTKYFLVERIAHREPNYFSVVGFGNQFVNLLVGKNTYIQNYNTAIFGDAEIGNHCTIGNYNVLSHHTVVKDFCHISSFSFINFTNLDQGNCLALRTNILGKPDHILNIPMHCNFMVGSVVTKAVSHPGTYFGNRLQSGETSLTYDVL